jgi:hypothetical protein
MRLWPSLGTEMGPLAADAADQSVPLTNAVAPIRQLLGLMAGVILSSEPVRQTLAQTPRKKLRLPIKMRQKSRIREWKDTPSALVLSTWPMRSSIELLFIQLALLWGYSDSGLVAAFACRKGPGVVVVRYRPTFNKIASTSGRALSLRDDKNDMALSTESELTPGSFNPFKYDAKLGLSASGTPPFAARRERNDNNVISLRRTQMQALTNSMLSAVPFEKEQLLSILQKNRQFLLEPLENDFAVQENDSIYLSCANRQERYRAFAGSMDSRLLKARDPSVRLVLQTMKDFVLEFENEIR